MDLYGRLVRDVLWPGLAAVRGRPTVGFLRYLERTQWATAEELGAIQSGLVRRMARRALRRADVRSPAELAARLEVRWDGGERGNGDGSAWREAAMWRFHGWAGYRPGMKVFYEDGEAGELERVVPRADAAIVVTADAVAGFRRIDAIAAECDVHDGLHVAMEIAVVEVLVRKPDGSARAAELGEVGELVVTDLQDMLTPRVRCAIGVRAVPVAPGRCPCGRWLQRVRLP